MQLVTEEEFRRQMGHPPDRPDNCGITTDAMAWIAKTARTAFARQPDDVSMEAMNKIIKLLNGKPVRDPNGRTRHRLLSETPPKLQELLTPAQLEAVDPRENKPISTGLPQQAVEKEFSDLQWYKTATPNYQTLLEEQYIAGMKRRYHVTPYGEAWIQAFADDPEHDIEELRSEGGLSHRFGVGLLALLQRLLGASTVETYYDKEHSTGSDNVDVYAEREINGKNREIVGEMIARHHNRELDASTYQKTERLSIHGCHPIYVFANLDRAKTVLRKWMRKDYLDIDRKIDNYDADRLREYVTEAYREDQCSGIWKFWTIPELHSMIFKDPPSPTFIDEFEW
jgi:hypothetical protein